MRYRAGRAIRTVGWLIGVLIVVYPRLTVISQGSAGFAEAFGAMVVLGHADTTLEKALGFVAVLLGAGNAAGGYVVTERMLDMFKSSKKEDAK